MACLHKESAKTKEMTERHVSNAIVSFMTKGPLSRVCFPHLPVVNTFLRF